MFQRICLILLIVKLCYIEANNIRIQNVTVPDSEDIEEYNVSIQNVTVDKNVSDSSGSEDVKNNSKLDNTSLVLEIDYDIKKTEAFNETEKLIDPIVIYDVKNVSNETEDSFVVTTQEETIINIPEKVTKNFSDTTSGVSTESTVTPRSEIDEINSFISELVIIQANKPISFRLEDPVSPFIGRISELSEIKWTHIDKKIVIITGIKGVGKTELARKYAREFRHDNTSSTIWINSESYTSIINSFKDLAITIGIEIRDKEIPQLIREVIKYFNNRKTLFIFDNSEDDNLLINNIPSFINNSRFISVIITSRQTNWDNPRYKLLPLNVFTLKESSEFIRLKLDKQLNQNPNNDSCVNLAEKLGNLPLALNGAVVHIIQQNILYPNRNYTILNYINELENETKVEPVVVVKEVDDKELNAIFINKIEEESKRLGGQISKAAKDVGKTVCRGWVNGQRGLRRFLGFTVNVKQKAKEQCQ